MTIKLALAAPFVCPYRLHRLSVAATDVLALKGGFELENPAGRFIAVRGPQFSAGAIAIGVHRADSDLQLPRDLFGGEMAVDEPENLSFALGQKPKLIWTLRRIRSGAHRISLARQPLAATTQPRAVSSAAI